VTTRDHIVVLCSNVEETRLDWHFMPVFFFFLSSTSLALPILEWLAALLILDMLSDECCRRILRSATHTHTHTHTHGHHHMTNICELQWNLQWTWIGQILKAENDIKALIFMKSVSYVLFSCLNCDFYGCFKALGFTMSWEW